jgi:diketogulonate reductase-like aldo/keto reductase
LFRRVRRHALPDWAREFDCTSWAVLFLKYVLAEPDVTCVIPATGNPDHMKDNLAAGFGTLPDAKQRQRIASCGTRSRSPSALSSRPAGLIRGGAISGPECPFARDCFVARGAPRNHA